MPREARVEKVPGGNTVESRRHHRTGAGRKFNVPFLHQLKVT